MRLIVFTVHSAKRSLVAAVSATNVPAAAATSSKDAPKEIEEGPGVQAHTAGSNEYTQVRIYHGHFVGYFSCKKSESLQTSDAEYDFIQDYHTTLPASAEKKYNTRIQRTFGECSEDLATADFVHFATHGQNGRWVACSFKRKAPESF